jgi:hypothetical protein
VFKTDADPGLVGQSAGDLANLDGLLVETSHLSMGASVSRTIGETLVKGQLLGSLLTTTDDHLLRENFQTAASILAQRTWLRETYVTRLFLIYGQNGGYWINPSLRYAPGSGLNMDLGVHVFGGDSDSASLTTTAFGLFADNDFVYVRLTLAF